MPFTQLVLIIIIMQIYMQNKYGHKSYRKHAEKVYLKHKHRGFCRLCGCGDIESRYMTNVLSIATVQKFLVKIISESCGIVIKRSDGLPVTVCRKCIAFVKKTLQYRSAIQNISYRSLFVLAILLTLEQTISIVE